MAFLYRGALRKSDVHPSETPGKIRDLSSRRYALMNRSDVPKIRRCSTSSEAGC